MWKFMARRICKRLSTSGLFFCNLRSCIICQHNNLWMRLCLGNRFGFFFFFCIPRGCIACQYDNLSTRRSVEGIGMPFPLLYSIYLFIYFLHSQRLHYMPMWLKNYEPWESVKRINITLLYISSETPLLANEISYEPGKSAWVAGDVENSSVQRRMCFNKNLMRK